MALVLESLGLPCKLELEFTEAEYTIDIALPDVMLAIEVDGPAHFMRNVPKPNGRTAGQNSTAQKPCHSLCFAGRRSHRPLLLCLVKHDFVCQPQLLQSNASPCACEENCVPQHFAVPCSLLLACRRLFKVVLTCLQFSAGA